MNNYTYKVLTAPKRFKKAFDEIYSNQSKTIYIDMESSGRIEILFLRHPQADWVEISDKEYLNIKIVIDEIL